MSAKNIYISNSVWRNLDYELRKELLKVMPRPRYEGRHAANAESDLRALGEHELATRLLEGVSELPSPLRERV